MTNQTEFGNINNENGKLIKIETYEDENAMMRRGR